MKNSILLFFLLILIPVYSTSQGTTAVPFVQIGPSPGLGGSYGANSVLPTDDTFGFFYSPAQLGVFSRYNNFSAQFYLKKMNWLPQFNFSDLYMTSQAYTGGYIVEDFYEGIDVNIGLGYMHTLLNLGENVYTDDGGYTLGTFNSRENYDAYSLGFGFEYFAKFSFGYTYKKINSNLAPSYITVGNETINGRVDASAHDFGLIVEVPILKDHLQNLDEAVFLDDNISLFSNVYLGYATTNIGDEITYNDEAQADPLPRTAKFGLGFSIGLMSEISNIPITLIELEAAREAHDILVNRSGVKFSYQYGLGDLDFANNVLQGEPNDLVQVNTSLRIKLFETVLIGIHKMKGPGYPEYIHNTSFIFSTCGFFKFITRDDPTDLISVIFTRFDLRYMQSETNSPKGSPLSGTNYKGISLTLHGIFE